MLPAAHKCEPLLLLHGPNRLHLMQRMQGQLLEYTEWAEDVLHH
jgi:hypothetical protein